jgi:hypothetical protein
VLDNADGPPSLEASLSTIVELFEGQINTATANGFCGATLSTLVAALLHFPEQKPKLELLGSGHNTNLMEDQADALWTRVHVTSDALASHILSSGGTLCHYLFPFV